MDSICVKKSEKYGRGVFAVRDIKKGELIEQAPVIGLPRSEKRHLKKTVLGDYYFNWGDEYEDAAIVLGYGSLYNHSYTPNATFDNNLDNTSIDFYALRDIKAGEEITINYNGEPDDQSPLWFEVL